MPEMARFLVPVGTDGKPDVAKHIKVLDAEVRGTYAEIVVDGTSARYLRERRYAREVALPKSHISISQVNTYLRCPLQYYWRYVEGLRIPPASALTFGKAVHAAIEHNYRHKMMTGNDVPVEEAKEAFAYAWDRMAPETQFEEGEKPGEVKDEGVRCTALYVTEVAPAVRPVAVEEEFELQFENTEHTLKGVVDLIDASGTIIDTKTTKRSPAADALEKDLQLTTYSLGYRTLKGESESGLRMDFIVRTKQPKITSLSAAPRSDREIQRLLKTIAYVARAIRDQLFYPQVHNFTCNAAGCGYWPVCQEKW